MKSIKRLFALFVFIITITSLSAQPPNPNGGNNPTSGGNNTVNGGAPIGGGLFILLGLGAAYGGRKTYKYLQDKKSLTD